MTRALYRALIVRLVAVGLSALTLGGLAVQTAQARPAPVDDRFVMKVYDAQ